MIEINNATKYYGSIKALDNVSIKVEKGQIHGLIGVNGSGKTTLIKALVGIDTLTSGELKVFGENVFENPSIKARIGYVADRNRFFKYYTVDKLIKFYTEIYPTFSIEKFDKYNQIMQLPKKKSINALSKGMQMRLSLMLNLSRNPEVLVLDEPTSGLDVIAKKEILGFIINEVEEREMTVLISSHHLSELEMLCDDMTMINKGIVTSQSTVSQMKEQIKKLQVVFKNPIEMNALNDEFILDVTNVGSIYYIVTSNIENTEQKLKALDVSIVEEIPMNIEEIFVHTNKSKENNI
ncbi:hypothetical protein AN641_09300 [Candidatus Epulonipiscioides gigas]|nr:hypothetical protein AN641_09300 [Epulopiscium sp. SCG-C07WGA-EpuloA2]